MGDELSQAWTALYRPSWCVKLVIWNFCLWFLKRFHLRLNRGGLGQRLILDERARERCVNRNDTLLLFKLRVIFPCVNFCFSRWATAWALLNSLPHLMVILLNRLYLASEILLCKLVWSLVHLCRGKLHGFFPLDRVRSRLAKAALHFNCFCYFLELLRALLRFYINRHFFAFSCLLFCHLGHRYQFLGFENLLSLFSCCKGDLFRVARSLTDICRLAWIWNLDLFFLCDWGLRFGLVCSTNVFADRPIPAIDTWLNFSQILFVSRSVSGELTLMPWLYGCFF